MFTQKIRESIRVTSDGRASVDPRTILSADELKSLKPLSEAIQRRIVKTKPERLKPACS